MKILRPADVFRALQKRREVAAAKDRELLYSGPTQRKSGNNDFRKAFDTFEYFRRWRQEHGGMFPPKTDDPNAPIREAKTQTRNKDA